MVALLLFDWLHLHNEDFTVQYWKFYRMYRTAAWYIEEKKSAEALATKLGYSKVSDEKLDVALKIRDYVIGGGFIAVELGCFYSAIGVETEVLVRSMLLRPEDGLRKLWARGLLQSSRPRYESHVGPGEQYPHHGLKE